MKAWSISLWMWLLLISLSFYYFQLQDFINIFIRSSLIIFWLLPLCKCKSLSLQGFNTWGFIQGRQIVIPVCNALMSFLVFVCVWIQNLLLHSRQNSGQSLRLCFPKSVQRDPGVPCLPLPKEEDCKCNILCVIQRGICIKLHLRPVVTIPSASVGLHLVEQVIITLHCHSNYWKKIQIKTYFSLVNR